MSEPPQKKIPERILEMPGWLTQPKPDEILETGLYAPFWGIEDLDSFAEMPDITSLEIALKLTLPTMCLLRMEGISEDGLPKAALFPFHLEDFCRIWNEADRERQRYNIPLDTLWLEQTDQVLKTTHKEGTVEIYLDEQDLVIRTGTLIPRKPIKHEISLLTMEDIQTEG